MCKFYLYVRVLYLITEKDKVVKIGITDDIVGRESTYKTSEYLPGEFIKVYDILYNGKRCDFDNCFKKITKEYHRYQGAGIEFYYEDLIEKMDYYIDIIDNIEEYRLLDDYELLEIKRKSRDLMTNITDIEESHNIKDSEEIEVIKPFKHQQDILDNIQNYYENNHIGKIIWACGLGKSLLILFIIKLMNFKSILIGVPSINLQEQFFKDIIKLYPKKDNILVLGGDGKNSTLKIIKDFLKNIQEPKFIVSTYHSCNLLMDISFDFKNGDEAHHLVGIEEDKKGFRNFHKIQSKKTLFTTATEKLIETTIHNVYSMNDETIFGKYIDKKSVNWAIENKKITDYNILVIKNTEDEVNSIISNLKIEVSDKTIFIACYMCLKSLEKYNDLTHVLLYTNTVKESEQAKKYINDILSLNILNIEKDKIYNNALHSSNSKDLKKEIELFKKSVYGIICCVYIFGEGFDLPKLNGVCIASNMSSIIRIVQYLLRPNRLEKGNNRKKAYQIIPYIDNNDWKCENKSYENVRHIISQMRTADENIEHKIKISLGYKRDVINFKESIITYDYNDFEENDNELTKLKMRLRYSKSLHSNFSEEQSEYNCIRAINISLNINSDSDYINSEYIHPYFIKNPEEYFKLKGVWTNWLHFYGTNTSNYIQTKEEWIKYCKDKNIKSLEDYNNNCKIYNELPANPSNFYNNFTNIENELGLIRNRRNRN
jgi:predicted helicase